MCIADSILKKPEVVKSTWFVRGGNVRAWILVSLWRRGRHSGRFPHHPRTQAGSENKMQGGDTPGLFRTALTVFVFVHCYRGSVEHIYND